MPQERCTQRIFRILMLLALTAGVAFTPFRLAAQTAEPAARSQAAAQSAEPSASQAKQEAAQPEKKSDEEQANVFRLEGPVVKWTARTFNTSPETAATIFEFLNFAVIVFGIGIPLVRFLPKVFRKRTQTVLHNIESARKVTEDANARLSAIEAKLSGLDSEINLIRVQVEAESRGDEARIKATIGEETARIVAAAEQEIDLSATQARRSLRNFAADLAIGQAAKQLVLTPETDRALIAEFLGDTALNGAEKGGQN